MALTARLDAAADRVDEERRAAVREREVLDEFRDRVEAVPVDGSHPRADGGATAGLGGGTVDATPSPAIDGLAAVREAFVELVVPAVTDIVADESPAATMRDELGADVAGALAGSGPLTPPLRTALLESAAERCRELDATTTVLDRESEALADARGTVTVATEWLREADRTPLTRLGFDALRARHERLAAFRDRCDDLARERQAFRRGTTGRDGCRVSHEPFLVYLYGDLGDGPEPACPVLGAVAELASVCERCQRSVRAHLVRRA